MMNWLHETFEISVHNEWNIMESFDVFDKCGFRPVSDKCGVVVYVLSKALGEFQVKISLPQRAPSP